MCCIKNIFSHCIMSILNNFTRADKETSSNIVIPTGGVPGISDKEIMNITDQIQKYLWRETQKIHLF